MTKNLKGDKPPMPDTIGALELKMVRLQTRLKILRQQQALSWPYPVHLTELVRQATQTRTHLRQLRRQRMELLNYDSSVRVPNDRSKRE
jgi:hypothetical protein